MIYPTLEQLSENGKYNRYTVTVAAAKGARMVTEEYCRERERAEQMVARKETDKSLSALIDKELRDEKAVRTSVHRLIDGRYIIEETAAGDEEGEEACLEEEQTAAAEETEEQPVAEEESAE